MEDCKKLLADGFGFVSCCRVDVTFYMGLAAVAASSM